MSKGDGHFPSTRWTLIGRLKSGDADAARRALDEICTQYRYPLYCYIRSRGFEHHDAEDALQDYFAKLVRLNAFAGADAAKGRLRAFLVVALGRFLGNWRRDRPHRERECSAEEGAAGDGADAERYRQERFVEQETPERAFERNWGFQLLERVLVVLGASYAARGKPAVFEALRPVLMAGGRMRGEECARLAATLGMSEGALRVALSRLLRDYRTVLEEEVFMTVASREEVADEIAHLLAVMQR